MTYRLMPTLVAAVLCATAVAGQQHSVQIATSNQKSSQSASQSASQQSGKTSQAKATARSTARGGQQSGTSESSQSSTIAEGDLSVTVTKRVKTTTDAEGNVSREEKSETKATLAGKEIPADRIRTNGTTIEILDEKGAVTRTIEAPDFGGFEVITSTEGPGGMRIFGRTGASGSASSGSSSSSGSTSSGKSSAQSSSKSGSGKPGSKSMSWIGEPATPPKVMLGLSMEEPDESIAQQLKVNPDETTLVMSVTPDLPAAKAGLKPHDVIVSIDGAKPATPDRIRAAMQAKEPGADLTLGVISGGDTKNVTVTLEAWDAGRLGLTDANTMVYTIDPNFGSGALDDEMRQQIEQMMREFEARFKDSTVDIQGPDGVIQQFFAPVPGGSGHTFKFVVPRGGATAATAPSAAGAAGAAGSTSTDDRIRQLEERIEKLNETIRKLEEHLKAAAESTPTTPPAPKH